MKIYVTDEIVSKDGKLLEQVVWVDPESGEACIFCNDRDGKKIPTNTDPSGYETLIVCGHLTVEKSVPSKTIEPQPTLDYGSDPYAYPHMCFETDRDGRNGSGIDSMPQGPLQMKTFNVAFDVAEPAHYSFAAPEVTQWVDKLAQVYLDRWTQTAIEELTRE